MSISANSTENAQKVCEYHKTTMIPKMMAMENGPLRVTLIPPMVKAPRGSPEEMSAKLLESPAAKKVHIVGVWKSSEDQQEMKKTMMSMQGGEGQGERGEKMKMMKEAMGLEWEMCKFAHTKHFVKP